jgi:hypothetical protein
MDKHLVTTCGYHICHLLSIVKEKTSSAKSLSNTKLPAPYPERARKEKIAQTPRVYSS